MAQHTQAFNEALRRALKELAKGDRFAAEIREVLERKGYAADVANEVLEHLNRKGLLSDQRAAESVLRRLSGKRAAGPAKIKQLLTQRGASAETVEAILSGKEGAQVVEIVDLLRAKFPSGATREGAGRFLYGRGFSEDAIESALEQWVAR